MQEKNASLSLICSDRSIKQNTNNKLWLRYRSLWRLMHSTQMDLKLHNSHLYAPFSPSHQANAGWIRHRQHWENMCGGFGLLAPLCSVKTLDLHDDPEKQLSVYSNLLNCFLLVCRWQAIEPSFQNIEQTILKRICLVVFAQRSWKGVLIIQLSSNLLHLSKQRQDTFSTLLLGCATFGYSHNVKSRYLWQRDGNISIL